MIKKIVFILIMFLALMSVGFSYVNVSSCGVDLNVVGEEYRLNQSISSASGDCITITNNNITLKCQNNNITGPIGSDVGILIVNKNFSTIDDCNIKNFNYGIRFFFSNNNTINNIKLNDNIRSLSLLNSSDSIFTNLNCNNSNVYSIDLTTSSKKNTFNTISITNSLSKGITISSSSTSNLLSNININNVSSTGISLGSYNNISTCTINNNDIGFTLGNFNNINSCIINNNNIGVLINLTKNNTISNSNIKYNNNYNLYLGDFSGLLFTVNNTFINNHLGDSTKIQTSTGNWSGFNNTFIGNYYTNFDGFLDGLCFDITHMSCDLTRQLEPISSSSSNIFPFESEISMLFMIILVLFSLI